MDPLRPTAVLLLQISEEDSFPARFQPHGVYSRHALQILERSKAALLGAATHDSGGDCFAYLEHRRNFSGCGGVYIYLRVIAEQDSDYTIELVIRAFRTEPD